MARPVLGTGETGPPRLGLSDRASQAEPRLDVFPEKLEEPCLVLTDLAYVYLVEARFHRPGPHLVPTIAQRPG